MYKHTIQVAIDNTEPTTKNQRNVYFGLLDIYVESQAET